MFVDQDFIVGFRHIDKSFRLTNRALLGYFEDAAGAHSTKVGYGLLDIPKTHLTWFLISVRAKVIKRPVYGDHVKSVTWASGRNKLYAFRDYELNNDNGEVVACGTSSWIPIDTRTLSVMRLTDEISDAYYGEDKHSFAEPNGKHLREPKSYTRSAERIVTSSMIDFNDHVHNTYYLDFIWDILPQEIKDRDIDEFEIFYKNQIHCGDIVKLLYCEDGGAHYVSVKSKDESELHAIIKLS